MKLLKYVIYLILLLGIGGAILISTDEGVYTTSEVKTVSAPQEMVYDALKNWENWENWHKRWTEDPTTSLHNESKVLEWASNNEMYEKGRIEFTKNIPYKTLEFDAEIQTSSGIMNQHNKIGLKENKNKETSVNWESEVTLSFWQKVSARLGKGDKYINSETDLFISSLNALDSILNDKMNEHNSEIVGLTELPERNYIHTATASNKANFISTATQKINELYDYTEKYGIPIKGVPEIIIHKRENNNRNFLFSVALPLPDEYELDLDNPEMVIGTFEERPTLKTTLKGNYKFWEETLELGLEYLDKQRLEYSLDDGIIIKWPNFKEQPVNPAEWLTELYIPAYEPETLKIP